MKSSYDVAIIGAGMGGASLAAILARQGLSVIVFEARQHPKFAIGESTILETSEMMRALAHYYDVPELAYCSSENYLGYAGTSHGVKRHFGFVQHTQGEYPSPAGVLQAVIPRQPYGHEVHIYRQDSDYFLTALAISLGAHVLQNTPVADLDIRSDGVLVTTQGGARYRARFIVDAGGFRSLIAQKLGLRRYDLQTHTRGMFTHMVDVPGFDEVAVPRRQTGVPFLWSEGTLHHLFEGGWLWVIPFNNHPASTNPLCSVGLLLDPRVHPQQDALSPEAEFAAHIARFPALEKQFRGAKAVRPWSRAPRLQYASTQVAGARWALLGHAAGFIDPLFSKGLYVTHMAVMVLADALLCAFRDDDFSPQRFAQYQRMTQGYIAMHDRLCANAIKSWAHPDLWRVYSVQWLLGAYLEYLMLSIARMRAADRGTFLTLLQHNRLAGGGFAEFFHLQEKVDTLFEGVNPKDATQVAAVVQESRALFEAFPWLPAPFRAVLHGATHLPRNKIRLSLLSPQRGFMGDGAYRRHFFGRMSLPELLRHGARDQIRYSRTFLQWQRRREHPHLAI